VNVASLPGIVKAAYAMPDAHWGYGFPIGGVAAFDPDAGGVISAGGVGFDISCGVRCLHTGLTRADLMPVQRELAEALYNRVPAGVGSTGAIRLGPEEMDAMLTGGAKWAVERGWGVPEDLERIEERGQMPHAKPACVSERARKRQRDEMGILGSGNHYLEIQEVTALHDTRIAQTFELHQGDIVVMIHCGSRGLGHQIGTEFLKRMALCAGQFGIHLSDRELACAPTVRASQGSDACLRSRPPGRSRAVTPSGPAGADRRVNGHRFIHTRRHGGVRGARVELRLPRRGSQHVSAPGTRHLAGPADRR
jgi:tRNA-splicing ligase RtcB